VRKSPHKMKKLIPLCLIAGEDDLVSVSRTIHTELLRNAMNDKSSTSFVIIDNGEVFVLDTSRLIGHFKVSENPKALVGVYTNRVSRDDLLEDLRFSFIPS